MTPIVPSTGQLAVLRGIAVAGFDYSTTKRLCSSARWNLVTDEPELGFVQYHLCLGTGAENQRLLSIGLPNLDGPRHLYLPLYYFPEDNEGGDPADHARGPFDDAYQSLRDGLTEMLGDPRREGTYVYAHRPVWPYSFRIWVAGDTQLVLLQDEHDIQFGMDVSLWLFAAEPEISIPLPL